MIAHLLPRRLTLLPAPAPVDAPYWASYWPRTPWEKDTMLAFNAIDPTDDRLVVVAADDAVPAPPVAMTLLRKTYEFTATALLAHGGAVLLEPVNPPLLFAPRGQRVRVTLTCIEEE